MRWKAYLKFLAVTEAPSLKRKPLRIVNVYTLPFLETPYRDATSGRNSAPAWPFLSG